MNGKVTSTGDMYGAGIGGNGGSALDSRFAELAADDVEVQAVTGESIQFVVEPHMIYDLYEGDSLVISSEDPGKRPLVFDIANGTISISVKNAAAGFVYYIIQSDTPDFTTVKMLDDSKVRATADGPIAVTGTFQPAPSKFFKVCLSDAW